jgi:hypothetical protein
VDTLGQAENELSIIAICVWACAKPELRHKDSQSAIKRTINGCGNSGTTRKDRSRSMAHKGGGLLNSKGDPDLKYDLDICCAKIL